MTTEKAFTALINWTTVRNVEPPAKPNLLPLFARIDGDLISCPATRSRLMHFFCAEKLRKRVFGWRDAMRRTKVGSCRHGRMSSVTLRCRTTQAQINGVTVALRKNIGLGREGARCSTRTGAQRRSRFCRLGTPAERSDIDLAWKALPDHLFFQILGGYSLTLPRGLGGNGKSTATASRNILRNRISCREQSRSSLRSVRNRRRPGGHRANGRGQCVVRLPLWMNTRPSRPSPTFAISRARKLV